MGMYGRSCYSTESSTEYNVIKKKEQKDIMIHITLYRKYTIEKNEKAIKY
jgi:hypothetical protein